jgi:hypothetical protein
MLHAKTGLPGTAPSDANAIAAQDDSIWSEWSSEARIADTWNDGRAELSVPTAWLIKPA